MFIQAGLYHYLSCQSQQPRHISVLEMGFGTGLNALLTKVASEQLALEVTYHTIEAFPISDNVVNGLNYCDLLELPDESLLQLHQTAWNETVNVSPTFQLHKHHTTLNEFSTNQRFDLVFYDAFGPGTQPELWTYEAFEIFHSAMNPNAVLTTYCSKGDVRRTLLGLGFNVEKIPGPPGKREMLRATKS